MQVDYLAEEEERSWRCDSELIPPVGAVISRREGDEFSRWVVKRVHYQHEPDQRGWYRLTCVAVIVRPAGE